MSTPILLSVDHQLFHYEAWICEYSCGREAGVWRMYGDILQSSSHVADIELTRWSTKEKRAYMETMNYQSAYTAERLINSRTLSQAWGKITKSIDIIPIFAYYSQVTPSTSSESFFLSPVLSHPPKHKKLSAFTLHSLCIVQRGQLCLWLQVWAIEGITGHLAGSYAQRTQQISLYHSSFSLFPDLRAANCFRFAASAGLTSKYSKMESRLCPLPGYPWWGESY